MSSRGETREQPSNLDPDPARAGPGHAYLGLTLVGGTAFGITITVDNLAEVHVRLGTYPLLALLVIVGMAGWLVRSAESRVAQRIEALAELHYQAGHDDGFVDGLAAGTSKVEGINGRRVKPLTHR